ncbi:hypothetical protein KOAAANKH_00079 [Brevundimonas sp. NIBR10]|uniref:SOS response-associated peptidase family protein n=1 Tax=Brevundimonas sp. NIBR10 TaxID=3015997 RepID=UPI0022F1B800|nr:SOS response-associated peptidase family protein [Brevundimonas sp. NIBR10]WGM45218.1 hypothetical protein KOAAANKH_00079 [Brevundimonas sp. NIBR10]
MCNLYSLRKGPAAIIDLTRALSNNAGNVEPRDLYPDYAAPIVRTDAHGVRELATARWGMPSSRKALLDAATRRADKLRAKGKPVDFDRLLELEPDAGTTNVRNSKSAHWRPWLSPANRCLVPFTAFSEPGRDAEGRYKPVWFRLIDDDPEPLAFFAGVHVRDHTCVRKIKTGLETCDLFAFLTTDPVEPVRTVHPKAMPLILMTEEERETWMRADWTEASELQIRAQPEALLEVFNRGAMTT